jgi:hypothetical protein
MIPPQLIQVGVQVLGTALSTITGAIAAKRAERTAAAEAQAKILEEVRNSQIAFNESVVKAYDVLWNEAQARMNQADKDYKAYVDKIRAETAASAKSDKMGGTFYGIVTSKSPFEVAYSNKAGAERKQFDGSAVYKDAYNAVYPTLPVNTQAQTDLIVVGAASKVILKNAETFNLGAVPDKFNTTKGGTLATVNALLGRPEPMTDVMPAGGPKSTTGGGGKGNYTILIVGGVIAAVVIYYMMNKKKKR